MTPALLAAGRLLLLRTVIWRRSRFNKESLFANLKCSVTHYALESSLAKLECGITGSAFEYLSPFSRKAGILSPNFEYPWFSPKFGIAGGAMDPTGLFNCHSGLRGTLWVVNTLALRWDFYSLEPRRSVNSSPPCGPHRLVTATFVGYQAAEISGALAATGMVFLMPWMLAAAASQRIAWGAFTDGWPYVFIATLALLLALWYRGIRS